jgi:hypothetical protein
MPELGPDLGEPRAHLAVERVQALRPVQPHDQDLPVPLRLDDSHCLPLEWSGAHPNSRHVAGKPGHGFLHDPLL